MITYRDDCDNKIEDLTTQLTLLQLTARSQQESG